jgi:hypothetical protein
VRVLEDQIIAGLGNYLREQEVTEEEILKLAQNLALPTDESLQREGLQRAQRLQNEGMPERPTTLLSPTSALLAGPEEIDDTETEDEVEGEAEPMVESNGTYVFSAWVLQQENPTQSR